MHISIHTVCIAARARRVCNVWLQYDGGGAAVTATIARIARRRLAPDRKNEEEYAVPSYPQVKGKIRYAYSVATRVGVLLDEYAHIEYPYYSLVQNAYYS